MDINRPHIPQIGQSPLLIVISGPSGAGKDSILRKLKECGMPFHFAVTANTRPKRADEVDGTDYYFVSKDKFVEMLQQGEFLEHAVVYGDYKGVPKQSIRKALAAGEDVILRLDVQGAITVKRLIPQIVLIFVMSDSEKELFERLSRRKTETSDSLSLRVAAAEGEMKQIKEFDYLVINRENQLNAAAEDMASIIQAEHCRVTPRVIQV
jgi:guanylate kinase